MSSLVTRINGSDVRVQRAIELIGLNYGKPLGVPDLARAVGLSVSYFSHLFREQVGISPAKFLRDFRMREAEHLMTTTALPLRAIIPKVGVTDRSHFVRKFREFYGLAPSTYRSGHRCDKT
jgi:transcriptional regulator GlxA family with amidase domain